MLFESFTNKKKGGKKQKIILKALLIVAFQKLVDWAGNEPKDWAKKIWMQLPAPLITVIYLQLPQKTVPMFWDICGGEYCLLFHTK